MNIDIFIEARKSKGLSQSELADGICTQATLSRFENNNQVPNLKILLKLCQRIDLSLGDLFPKVSIQVSKDIEIMNEAEFNLITSCYAKSLDLLEGINIDAIEDVQLRSRYYYIKAYSLIFTGSPLSDVLFNFDQVLFNDAEDHIEIYSLLSYAGIGMVNAREQEQEKAEFYFGKVLQRIYAYPIKSTEDTWRVLNIVYHSGEFYSNSDELVLANALLDYAITICMDNHVTYYLARATYQLAINAINQNESVEKILELIRDARAYAKINRNTIKIDQLNELEKKYL